jgi:hypothetical protein
MMEIFMPDRLQSLRAAGIIGENEIAFKIGDLYVAENVLTRNRRNISIPDSVLNERREILRG